MTNKKLLILPLLFIIIVSIYLTTKKTDAPIDTVNATSTPTVATEEPATSTNPKMVTGSDKETFSGKITAVDTGCFVDAVCSVSVDGKKIILMTGGIRMNPDQEVGKLVGVESIGDLEGKIGVHANVYAAPTREGDYTLYGSSKYYVEVTDMR